MGYIYYTTTNTTTTTTTTTNITMNTLISDSKVIDPLSDLDVEVILQKEIDSERYI